jgi:hypothetical protein
MWTQKNIRRNCLWIYSIWFVLTLGIDIDAGEVPYWYGLIVVISIIQLTMGGRPYRLLAIAVLAFSIVCGKGDYDRLAKEQRTRNALIQAIRAGATRPLQQP